MKAYTGKERLGRGFAYYRAFNLSAESNRNAQRRLTVPILALGGQYALGEQIGNALKAIAEPKVMVIKDCGHYVPEEQPEETIKYIRMAIGG